MKVDASAQAEMSSYEQAEQLEDAIEIMADRLDGSGVAEPVIRPQLDAIEIQMPGASTEAESEIIDVIKPARLEFRAVHETLDPYTTTPRDYPVGYEVLAEEREDRATGEITGRKMFVKRIRKQLGKLLRMHSQHNRLRGHLK